MPRLRPFVLETLTRIAAGQPAFARPARRSQAFWRQAALRELKARGFIVAGKWGPVVSEAGRAATELHRNPAPHVPVFWTPERVAVLRRDYATLGAAALAERLGTTAVAVRNAARRCGACSRKPHMPWTESARAVLRKRYPAEGAGPIAADTGRTHRAVVAAAGALGLRFEAYGTVRSRVPLEIDIKNA